jgi:hypothetical protein
MWVEVVIFIIIVLLLIGWADRNFSEGGRVRKLLKKLSKRIVELDNEVYKIFKEDQKFNTDSLAYVFSDATSELYYKIATLNKEIDITGKLIDALLDYYGFTEYARYQPKTKEKNKDDIIETRDLYVQKKSRLLGFSGIELGVREALEIREEEMRRRSKDAELKRKKEIY